MREEVAIFREIRDNCIAVNSTMQTASSTKIFDYHDLIAWQKADELAHAVYTVTEKFPRNENFGLTSQLRRASLSVPTNIVEGFSRLNKNEFRHFLAISFGSLAEARYLLEFANKRLLIADEEYQPLAALREECSRLIWKLYKSQEKTQS